MHILCDDSLIPLTVGSGDMNCTGKQQSANKVMLAAVKCKQNVDPALADALDAAVAEMSKMWLVLQNLISLTV